MSANVINVLLIISILTLLLEGIFLFVIVRALPRLPGKKAAEQRPAAPEPASPAPLRADRSEENLLPLFTAAALCYERDRKHSVGMLLARNLKE